VRLRWKVKELTQCEKKNVCNESGHYTPRPTILMKHPERRLKKFKDTSLQAIFRILNG
jgi:hypothetical protein